MQIADKLSMLRSRHNGIMQNMVTIIIVNVLRELIQKIYLNFLHYLVLDERSNSNDSQKWKYLNESE